MAGDLFNNLFSSSALPLTPAPPVSNIAPFTQDPTAAAKYFSAAQPQPFLSRGTQQVANSMTPQMIMALRSSMTAPPPPPVPAGALQRPGLGQPTPPSALNILLQDPRFKQLLGIRANLGG